MPLPTLLWVNGTIDGKLIRQSLKTAHLFRRFALKRRLSRKRVESARPFEREDYGEVLRRVGQVEAGGVGFGDSEGVGSVN